MSQLSVMQQSTHQHCNLPTQSDAPSEIEPAMPEEHSKQRDTICQQSLQQVKKTIQLNCQQKWIPPIFRHLQLSTDIEIISKFNPIVDLPIFLIIYELHSTSKLSQLVWVIKHCNHNPSISKRSHYHCVSLKWKFHRYIAV